MDKTDNFYIQEAIRGNTKAFEWLIVKYKDMVYTLALKMLKQTEEAEELAQDVFINVYKSLNKFKGKSKFSTWVYQITYNLSINKLKKLKKAKRNRSLNDADENSLIHKDSFENTLDKNEQNKLLNKALDKLPPQERFIISLYYFDDLSLKEISEVVGLKEGNLKVKLYRSRVLLYKELQHRVSDIKLYYDE